MSRRKTAVQPSTDQGMEFALVLALCRSAVAAGDEVLRHQVRRLLEHLEAHDQARAASVRELLAEPARGMTPIRLQRSRAMRRGEELTKAIRPPVDRETAVPLAEIVWQEQLPSRAPALPENLERAMEAIIDEWSNPEALASLGVRPTRMALFYGLPGTGKTHLALWLAGQLGLPVVVARLDGLVSSFLGTTSRNIGHLFDFVDKYECALLLDEFDAVAKLRDDPQEMGEIKRVVNTILQRLDQRRDQGLTIGITNHEQLLDPAVWRRFEVQIHMPKPTVEGRAAILNTYLVPMELSPGQTNFLAWLCDGMTGAEIETFVRTIKRLTALKGDAYHSFADICRLAVGVHAERVTNHRKEALAMSDQGLAKVLSDEAHVDSDLVALGQVFGKSKSTIARWINK